MGSARFRKEAVLRVPRIVDDNLTAVTLRVKPFRRGPFDFTYQKRDSQLILTGFRDIANESGIE